MLARVVSRFSRHAAAAPWVAIFGLAAVLSCSFPEATFFGGDQFRDLQAGRCILSGDLFIRGPAIAFSKVGLGSGYYYLVALGLLPRDDPSDAVVFVNALRALGVLGYAFLACRMFGRRAGILTGLLLALHPVWLLGGRTLSNPVLVLPVSCIFATGLWLWLGEKRSAGLGILIVGAGLMIHVHLALMLLLPLVIIPALLRRGEPLPRSCTSLALGVSIGLALTAAWLVVEARGWAERGLTWNTVLGSVRQIDLPDATSVSYWKALIRGLIYESRLDAVSHFGSGAWRTVVDIMGYVFGGLVLIGLFRALRRTGTSQVPRILLAWGAVVPCAVLAILRPGFQMYYLDITVPFRVMLAVYAIESLATRYHLLLAGIAAVWMVHDIGTLAEDVQLGLRKSYQEEYDLSRAMDHRITGAKVTMAAKKRIAHALTEWFGPADDTNWRKQTIGPWRLFFAKDTRPWPRKYREHTGADRCSDALVIIAHSKDTYPLPCDSQRLYRSGKGMFEVIAFRSHFRRKTWEVRVPGINGQKGAWSHIPGGFPLRPVLTLPCKRLTLRGLLEGSDGIRSCSILVSTLLGTSPGRVHVDGRAVDVTSHWSLGLAAVHAHDIGRLAAGDHEVTIEVENSRSDQWPWMVDVFDVWRD